MGLLKMSGISRLNPQAALIHFNVRSGQRPGSAHGPLVCANIEAKHRRKYQKTSTSPAAKRLFPPSVNTCSNKGRLCASVVVAVAAQQKRPVTNYCGSSVPFCFDSLTFIAQNAKQILTNVIFHKVAGWKS